MDNKTILTNLLDTWDELSDEAKLIALLTVARQIEEKNKPAEDNPPALGIAVAESISSQDGLA